MALTTAEKNALRAIVSRDGGLDAVFAEVRDLAIADAKASGLAALAGAVSVTVSDWAALAAYVAANNTNLVLYDVLADITAAAQARDASKLGPLFVAFYAAAKAHFQR